MQEEGRNLCCAKEMRIFCCFAVKKRQATKPTIPSQSLNQNFEIISLKNEEETIRVERTLKRASAITPARFRIISKWRAHN